MDMQQVSYFIKVAETENISRAAELLYVSQPTLSRVVKRLEEELGCSLFSHRGKNISLTESGRAFYARAQEMLQLFQRTREELNSLSGAGRESVTVQLRCMSGLFLELLGGFMAEEENTLVQLLQSDNGGVERGAYDLLLSPAKEPVAAASSRPILKEEIFIGVSGASPLAEKPVLTVEDLAGERYVSIAANRYFYQLTLPHRQEMGCRAPCSLYCDDMVAVRNLIRDQGYISHIPQYTWTGEDLRGVSLKRVEGFPLYRYITLTVNGDAGRNRAALRLRQYLLRALEERGLLYSDGE